MSCGFVIFFTYSRRGTCAAAQSIWSQTVAAVASPGMEPSEQSFVTNVTIRIPCTHSKFGNTCNSTGWLTGRNCATGLIIYNSFHTFKVSKHMQL